MKACCALGYFEYRGVIRFLKPLISPSRARDAGGMTVACLIWRPLTRGLLCEADLASYVIGASPHYFPARRDRLSHQLSLGLLPHGERWLVCVHIRLFATHNTPAYLVIAGELITSRQDLLDRFGFP